MKHIFRRLGCLLLAMLLVVGLVPLSASAANHTGGRVYFETDWTNPCIQLMIGHSGWSQGYPMTKEAGNRYYVDVPTWDGAWDFAVFGTDGEWGGENNSIGNRKQWAPNSTGVDNSGYQFQSGKKYLITSTGSDNVSVKEVYSVNVAATTNGTITISKTLAAAGESVLIIATPASGYDLESIVYEPDGQSKVYINAADNRYYLEMPAANVTVSAVFKKHVHSWTYTGDGTDKFTASCGCGKSETLQIHAPDWQNSVFTATLSDGNGGTAPASVGEQTVGQIVYAGADGTDYAESTTAPTAAGKYTASVTVGDKGQITVKYEIIKTDPSAPTGLVAYYSNTLADITLPTGWTWDDPTASVGDVGSKTFKASFAGNATTNAASGVDVAVKVEPSEVKLEVSVNKTSLEYGETLEVTVVRTPTGKPADGQTGTIAGVGDAVAVGDLITGKAYVDGDNPPMYTEGGTKILIDTAAMEMTVGTYTNLVAVTLPTDNMETATIPLPDITITKATPEIVTPPTASAITNGQTLADSQLTGGEASVPGTFAWEDATVQPALTDSDTTEYTVVFTPDDTDNYNTVTCKVKVTVDSVVYKVTLDPNYGSEAPYTEDVVDGDTLYYWSEFYEPYRNDHRFEGWFASTDSGATFTGEAVDLDALVVTADVTLYAKWTRVYSVYVEGIQATEHNISDMLGDGTVSYDPETNTLTLNNASLEGVRDEENGNVFPAITAVAFDKALTLELKGNNTATAISDPSYQATAVEVHGDLKITGSGNLTASAKSAAGTQQEGSYGIRASGGSLTMNGTGTVTGIAEAETRNTYCYGVSASFGITVNSGTLRGFANKDTSSTDVSCGVYSEGSLDISGGKLIAYAGATGTGHMRGIYVSNDVSVGADAHLESYGTEFAIAADSITVAEAKRVLEVKDEKEDASEYRKTVEDDEWEDFDYVKTVPIFTVTFVAEGVTMDEQTVPSGADATMPEVPAKEGYTGTWDSDGKNITKDTTITAKYEKIPSGETGGNTGGVGGDSDNPDTGDSFDMILWISVLLVSAAAVLVLILARKKFFYNPKHMQK